MSVSIQETLEALLSLKREFIWIPNEDEIKRSKSIHQAISGFPGVFGVVDGKQNTTLLFLLIKK